jgi:hypothetical protein
LKKEREKGVGEEKERERETLANIERERKG